MSISKHRFADAAESFFIPDLQRQMELCLYDDFADTRAATALSPSKKTSNNQCVPPEEIQIFMDLLDCNAEEGEAGAPAHLGGHRCSRRR